MTDEIPDDNALGYLPIISPKGERPIRYATEYEWIKYRDVEITRMEVSQPADLYPAPTDHVLILLCLLCRQIGSALIHLRRSGVLQEPYQIDPSSGPDAGWGVGIWAGNRPGTHSFLPPSCSTSTALTSPAHLSFFTEWQMTDMACSAFSLVPVALYDTLGPQATEYVANHATLPIIFTSLAHLPSLLKLLPKVPTVKAIVCYETLDGSEGEMARAWAKESGVWIADWNERQYLHLVLPLSSCVGSL